MLKKIIFLAIASLLTFAPLFSPALTHWAPGVAVICGVVLAVGWGNPFAKYTGKLTSQLLAFAIVLMGFGMNLGEVLRAGASGLAYTLSGIVLGLAGAVYLGKKLGVGRNCAWLIGVGTSICGGSAIAAAAPVLKAEEHDIAIASATVFTLNAVALLVFPAVGHRLGMGETEFGFWAALAIHDTSSVVGASLAYGKTALEVGTSVKLARALWIMPVTLYLSLFVAGRVAGEGKRKVKFKIPYFIPGFIAAAALVYFVPALAETGRVLKQCSQHLMILTLFLIGANLNRQKLRELGLKPVVLGVSLWVFLSTLWCVLITTGVIKCVV